MYLVYHGMRPEKQKIENRQINLDFNEIWCMWVILGVESEFRVILLFFLDKMVKKCHFMHFRCKNAKK